MTTTTAITRRPRATILIPAAAPTAPREPSAKGLPEIVHHTTYSAAKLHRDFTHEAIADIVRAAHDHLMDQSKPCPNGFARAGDTTLKGLAGRHEVTLNAVGGGVVKMKIHTFALAY